jgi:threonyl-tRNA synthetase
MERMTAYLIENFAGALPTWLMPVQAKIIPVSPAFEAYANEVTERMRTSGIRVEADNRNEKLGYKIREAQLEKIPFMLVVGENEMNSGSLSIRKRGQGDLGAHPVDHVIAMIQEEIRTKQ